MMSALPCVMFFLAATYGCPVKADSWSLPSERSYLSADGGTRVTITPRSIPSQLAYFDELADGPRTERTAPPRARVEHQGDEGWTLLWEGNLVNDVAPVHALVANGGDYTVTFDNWHMVGVGEHVVVIYDRSGNLIRSLALSDILPEAQIDLLPSSVSSISWGGDHHIDGDQLILKVRLPGEEDRFRDVPVTLATGEVGSSELPFQAWTPWAAGALLLLGVSGGIVVTRSRRRKKAMNP